MSEKKTGKFRTFITCIVLFPILLILKATVLFFLLAMLPTLVSLVLDNKYKLRYKYKWLCIGGMNFAGTLPFLFRLWFEDNSLEGAIGLFFDFKTIFVAFGSALVGFIFSRCIPPIILSIVEIADQRRVQFLRDLQRKLVDKWGDEVTEAPAGTVVASAPKNQ